MKKMGKSRRIDPRERDESMPVRKRYVILALILALVCALTALFSGCGNFSESGEQTSAAVSEETTVEGYRRITAQQAKEIMDSGKPYVLLDVRSQVEHNLKYIDGDILIPHREIEEKAPELLPDKNKTILVYCASGVRSKAASQTLIRMGYTNVYDFGAITDWPYGVVEEK